jgi:hypothetical protein
VRKIERYAYLISLKPETAYLQTEHQPKEHVYVSKMEHRYVRASYVVGINARCLLEAAA